MVNAMANRIPNCQATFYPQEAHLSTIVNHVDEIMTAITRG